MRAQLEEISRKAPTKMVSLFESMSRSAAGELAIDIAVGNEGRDELGLPELCYLIGILEASPVDEHTDAAVILTEIVDVKLGEGVVAPEDVDKPAELFKKLGTSG